MTLPPDENPLSPPPPPSGTDRIEAAIASIFVGPQGIRAGWRFLIFVGILFLCAGFLTVLWLLAVLGPHQMGAPGQRLPLTATNATVSEAIMVFSMAFAALIMSRIERRRVGEYGLPRQWAFGRLFWQGAAWGFVAISLTMALIAVLHGFSLGKIGLSGRVLIGYALLWALAFLLTGFFEEFTFRGYGQFTLTTGMGFWPSAIFLSLLFGAIHLGNHGEGWSGALSAGLIGFFFCLTLRRTGNIWFAVGLHAAWDYGETFIYGVPDSGLVAPGHLFNSSFHGPHWLTGGSIGPEGSVLCFVVLALLFLVFHFAYPARAAAEQQAGVKNVQQPFLD
jgi:membrane protease YdiL (CAAX protease family)